MSRGDHLQAAAPSTALAIDDVTQLLPQFLDQLATLGDRARQINQSLGSNDHRVEALGEILKSLGGQL